MAVFTKLVVPFMRNRVVVPLKMTFQSQTAMKAASVQTVQFNMTAIVFELMNVPAHCAAKHLKLAVRLRKTVIRVNATKAYGNAQI